MGPKELAAMRPKDGTVFCVCENRWRATRCARCGGDAGACGIVNGRIHAQERAEEKAAETPARTGGKGKKRWTEDISALRASDGSSLPTE